MERQLENFYLENAREQQIDPKTGDLYPWWVAKFNGSIEFDPYEFKASYAYTPRGDTFKVNSNPNYEFENPWNLRNLKFIDPASVDQAIQRIQEMAEGNNKPICVFIGTGGTISMKSGVVNGQVGLFPLITPDKLIEKSGRNNEFVSAVVNFPHAIDSSQMEVDYTADLAIVMSYMFLRLIELRNRFGGFIVTHGTDTAVSSQTYLSSMLGPNCPFNAFYVVSQRTIETKDSDAVENVDLTLEVMKKLIKKGFRRGVHGICAGGVNGGCYNGPTSKKISDIDIDLFEEHSSQGMMVKARKSIFGRKLSVNLPFQSQLKDYKDIADNTHPLPFILRGQNVSEKIRSELGDDPEKYDAYVRHSDKRYFVIETFGSFTANRKIVDAIVKAARETGKLVFAVNPFPEGSTDHQYADARYLTSQGVIPLKMLSHATHAKLKLASALFGDDQMKIIKFMTENNFFNEQLYIDNPPSIGGRGEHERTDSVVNLFRRQLSLESSLRGLIKNDDLKDFKRGAKEALLRIDTLSPTFIDHEDRNNIYALNQP